MSGKKTCWKKLRKTENKGHGQLAVQFFLANDTKGTGGINVIKVPIGLIRNDDCCCYCFFNMYYSVLVVLFCIVILVTFLKIRKVILKYFLDNILLP